MVRSNVERISSEQRDRILLQETAALLAADYSLNEVFETLCELLARFIDASVVFVGLRRPDGTAFVEYLHDHGETRPSPGIPLQRKSTSATVMRTGQPVFGGHPSQWVQLERIPLDPDRPQRDDTVSAIFVPMHRGEHVLGVLSVQSPLPDAYQREDVDLLLAVGRYLAIAVHNQQLFARLRESAETDRLTQLVTHARLLSAIDDGLRTIASTPKVLAVAVIDIVNFGLFNDTFGAEEGDRVLCLIADRIRTLGNEATVVGRFTSDDFMIVATREDQSAGRAAIDDIEAACRNLCVHKYGAVVPITTAIGFAVAPYDGNTRATLLSLATMRARLGAQSGVRAYGGNDEISDRHFGDFTGLEPIVESALVRDPYTRTHLIHVNNLALRWGTHLGLTKADLDTFVQAAFLHDIGKLLIPDRILMKPARLTPAEFETMKQHVGLGENMLLVDPRYREVAAIVAQHHERYDGTGYPNRTCGEDIHPLARAISVIDAYSAMTVDRPYHRGISEAAALTELERNAGGQFDPHYVEHFVGLRRRRKVVGNYATS